MPPVFEIRRFSKLMLAAPLFDTVNVWAVVPSMTTVDPVPAVKTPAWVQLPATRTTSVFDRIARTPLPLTTMLPAAPAAAPSWRSPSLSVSVPFTVTVFPDATPYPVFVAFRVKLPRVIESLISVELPRAPPATVRSAVPVVRTVPVPSRIGEMLPLTARVSPVLIVTVAPAWTWSWLTAVLAVTTGLLATLGMMARSPLPGAPAGDQLVPVLHVVLVAPVHVLSTAQQREAERRVTAATAAAGRMRRTFTLEPLPLLQGPPYCIAQSRRVLQKKWVSRFLRTGGFPRPGTPPALLRPPPSAALPFRPIILMGGRAPAREVRCSSNGWFAPSSATGPSPPPRAAPSSSPAFSSSPAPSPIPRRPGSSPSPATGRSSGSRSSPRATPSSTRPRNPSARRTPPSSVPAFPPAPNPAPCFSPSPRSPAAAPSSV